MRVWLVRHPVLTYYALAAALTWSYWLYLFASGIRVGPGSQHSHLPGLVGPMVAAFVVSALVDGGHGVRDLLARMVRLPERKLLAVAAILAAPVLAVVVVLAGWLMGGPAPVPADFLAYPGVASGTGVLGLLAIVTALNGFGEEVGWRGFAIDRLAPRRGAFWASVVVALIWALWHWPAFLINQTLAGLIGPGLIGWLIGLVLGAFVLTDLYLITGRSILAVALWHAAYNLSVAVPGAAGVPAAVVSTAVMVWGVVAAWRLWRRGRAMPPT